MGTNGTGRETEYKYLIAMPDTGRLEELADEIWDVTQTYLKADGFTRRVRIVVCGGETRYFYTEKRRLSGVSALETERSLTRGEYEQLLGERRNDGIPIRKTRYRIPHEGHVLEFDIYPFWTDRAILEIEVAGESVVPALPEWVRVLKDVTEAPEYKNSALSLRIPYDEVGAAKTL